MAVGCQRRRGYRDPAGSSVLTLSLNSAGLALGVASGTVQVAATGAANAPLTITVSVDVKDTTKPVLTLPANLTAAAAGPAGATVTYSASATDDSGTAPSVSCTPASGTVFALGVTTVNCSASDVAGNTATGSFTITVEDRSVPVLTLPATLVLEATSAAGAVAAFSVTATDSVDTTPTVGCTPASGSTFALGTRAVLCTASDDAGNSASGTFDVTVRDTARPGLSLPANITTPGGASGAAVTFTVGASDLVSGAVAVSCTPSSGSTFPIGTTVVGCSASDAAGNTVTGSFSVTVTSPTSFSVSPASLYFKTGRLAYCNGIAVGPNWKDQGLVVTNTGGTALSYVATTATSWLRMTPASGSVATGGSTTLTVSVDLTGLGRGIYSGSLTLTGNGSVSKVIPVTLEIGNALPTLCLTPTNTPLGAVKVNKTSVVKYFDVLNVGDDPLGDGALRGRARRRSRAARGRRPSACR